MLTNQNKPVKISAFNLQLNALEDAMYLRQYSTGILPQISMYMANFSFFIA
jgi:hypothetical protein